MSFSFVSESGHYLLHKNCLFIEWFCGKQTCCLTIITVHGCDFRKHLDGTLICMNYIMITSIPSLGSKLSTLLISIYFQNQGRYPASWSWLGKAIMFATLFLRNMSSKLNGNDFLQQAISRISAETCGISYILFWAYRTFARSWKNIFQGQLQNPLGFVLVLLCPF